MIKLKESTPVFTLLLTPGLLNVFPDDHFELRAFLLGDVFSVCHNGVAQRVYKSLQILKASVLDCKSIAKLNYEQPGWLMDLKMPPPQRKFESI